MYELDQWEQSLAKSGQVDVTAQLIIHSLPQVRLQPQGSLVKLTGSRLDISCSVSGDPRPTIAWRRMSKWVLLAVWSTRYRDHEFRSIHGHDAKDRLYSHDLCYDLVILSSCHLVILSSCHFVILSSCHLVILSSFVSIFPIFSGFLLYF